LVSQFPETVPDRIEIVGMGLLSSDFVGLLESASSRLEGLLEARVIGRGSKGGTAAKKYDQNE
jgi:hypothetical protein